VRCRRCSSHGSGFRYRCSMRRERRPAPFVVGTLDPWSKLEVAGEEGVGKSPNPNTDGRPFFIMRLVQTGHSPTPGGGGFCPRCNGPRKRAAPLRPSRPDNHVIAGGKGRPAGTYIPRDTQLSKPRWTPEVPPQHPKSGRLPPYSHIKWHGPNKRQQKLNNRRIAGAGRQQKGNGGGY